MGDYGLLLQSMGFLIIIILLAYFVLRYGLKSLYRGFNGGRIEVIERALLDPKSGSSLVLVRIGRELLLIGAAQGGVTLIKKIEEKDLALIETGDPAQYGNIRESFSRIIDKIRKGSSPGQDGGGNAV